MTTIIDGSAGITFPSGSNPQAAPSKVLQVVQGITNTGVTTTSSSYVTTGLTASITPLFATSKILAFYSVPTQASQSSSQPTLTLYRGSTNLALTGSTYPAFSQIYSSGSNLTQATQTGNYLDSPATTTSTTYTVYIVSTNGNQTVQTCNNGCTATLLLMEIAQ